MREYDRENTNPIIVEEELRFPKGTRNGFRRPMGIALVGGDWLISPSGVKGYIAGRSLDNPEAWIFVIQSEASGWPTTTVEMTSDSFVGFKHLERK